MFCLDLDLFAKIKRDLVSTHSLKSFLLITQGLNKILKNSKHPFVAIVKQKNDSPLQLNTEECTFRFSLYIFLWPLTCSRLKIFIAWHALSWKYFALIERKSCGKEILRDILWVISFSYKVYIFLLKVLLYLLIIFWNIRIDTLYEENGSRKIPPGGISTRKIPTHQSPSWEILTWNFPIV